MIFTSCSKHLYYYIVLKLNLPVETSIIKRSSSKINLFKYYNLYVLKLPPIIIFINKIY